MRRCAIQGRRPWCWWREHLDGGQVDFAAAWSLDLIWHGMTFPPKVRGPFTLPLYACRNGRCPVSGRRGTPAALVYGFSAPVHCHCRLITACTNVWDAKAHSSLLRPRETQEESGVGGAPGLGHSHSMRACPHSATMGQCYGDHFSLTWCLVKPKAKAHGLGFILHRSFRAASLTCRLTHTPTRRSTSAPASPFLKIVRVASTTRFKSSAGSVLQVFDHYLGRDLFSRAASLGELGRAWGHHLGELPVRGRVYSGYFLKPAFWSQKTRKRYECIGELHIERLRPQYTPSKCCHETR